MNLIKQARLLPLATLALISTSAVNAATPFATTSNAKDARTSYILSASMAPGAMNCGPNNRVTTGWVVDTEAYFNHKGVSQSTLVTSTNGPNGGQFNTGVFTTPVDGYYQINVSVRAETQNVDLVLQKNGSIIAGLGTDMIQRVGILNGQGGSTQSLWSTHSVSKNLYLQAGDVVDLVMKSSQSTDCIMETAYKYNQFNVFLIRATGGNG